MTRKGQRPAEAVQDLSVAGDREVLSKAYDPQNIDRTGQARQHYDEIEPRREAEITALQRLIPGLSDSECQHLRPALRFWCAAARRFLNSPQTEDDDGDFSLALFEAYNITWPGHRRSVGKMFHGIFRELGEAERVVPRHCLRWHSHALALMLNRIGMPEGDECA
jgi:hypothetical protein